MGGELRYEIGQNAYIKFVLRALKHKTSAVNVLLLGRLSGGDANPVVETAESVPLFHSHHIGLLPPREIALMQIDGYYSAQGLNIVGYFHDNERCSDFELGNVAKNIGDHIHRCFPQAALLLLDNKKLEALPKGKNRDPVIQERFLCTKDLSNSWKLVGSDGSSRLTVKEPSANILLLYYVSSQKWQEIVDFYDHLVYISKDWLNPELFKESKVFGTIVESCWNFGQSTP
ncbi:ER membrane protein complex subunit 8/9 homolog isoform X2 [Actinidia eriantha]|uniref:ER membrane protein complex subunit 8/9 homolog isoform X2 n=1 Tax=Actinidia eriantha TaxID=165200 RepID=UPI00258A38D7|nr:ER membrane protein complex subunit 8/9 homolog isoform X2 [Actinidia eriantha]